MAGDWSCRVAPERGVGVQPATVALGAALVATPRRLLRFFSLDKKRDRDKQIYVEKEGGGGREGETVALGAALVAPTRRLLRLLSLEIETETKIDR